MGKNLTFQEARTGAVGDESDGSYPVTLLTPGQGATAYYSEEVIRRDAPAAFPKGTHVYLDHLQEGEQRTAAKILGTLIEHTTIRESDGAAVNRFKPVKNWAPLVEDVHKIAGLSINAAGTAKLGMVDGRSTRIAESIDYHITNSVDLVSYPGRPGSGFTESYDSLYQEAMEAAGEHKEVQPNAGDPEGNQMELKEQLDELGTKVAALTTLVESLAPKAPEKKTVEDAGADRAALVESLAAIHTADVPASVKTRLTESVKAGADIDVAAEIASVVALREELKTEFKESGAVGATGASGSAAPVTVNGWAK